MKKLFIVFAAIATFSSCKKDHPQTQPDVTPQPDAGKTITTTRTSVYGTDVETVNYNTEDKIIKSQLSIQSTNTTWERSFNYGTIGKIIVSEKSNGVLKYTYNCDVNLKGNVVAMNVYKPDGSLYENREYSYDANDYIVKIVITDNTGSVQTSDFKIVNGNLVERKIYNGSSLSKTIRWTYDLYKTNKYQYAINAEWKGNGFGKINTNLITNIKEQINSGGYTKNEDRVYVMNANGTVQKFTAFDNAVNVTYEEKYTYSN